MFEGQVGNDPGVPGGVELVRFLGPDEKLPVEVAG